MFVYTKKATISILSKILIFFPHDCIVTIYLLGMAPKFFIRSGSKTRKKDKNADLKRLNRSTTKKSNSLHMTETVMLLRK